MIKLEDGNLKIAGNILLKGINLCFDKGNIYHLTGSNGSGKTTLMESLIGLNSFLEGKLVSSFFNDYTYLPQSSVSHPKINLKLKDISSNVYDFFPKELLEKKWSKASGGERKRALLARLFNSNSTCFIIDEPFNHLDQKTIQKIWNELEKRKIEGALIILTGHIESHSGVIEVGVDKWK